MKKRRFKKRILAFGIAAMMAGTVVFPMQGTVLVHAETEKSVSVDGFNCTYKEETYNNKTYAVITKMNIASTVKLTIPTKIDNIPVGKLGTNLFKGNATLQTVTIPSTVYKVESSAFDGCTSLTSVKFSDNVASKENLGLTIGVCAFRKCSNLKTVEFRKNIDLLSVQSQAFENCENLEISEFTSDVNFSYSAFRKCYSLKNIVFKGNAILQGDVFSYSFQDDETEKKITFEKDVEMINLQGAPLAYCSGLREIEFNGKVKLCEGAFTRNSSLRKITWGEGIDAGFYSGNTVGGTMVFYGCDALKTFEFKTGNIHMDNFYGDIPELDKVIYDSDIKLNYWFDAVNVVFKGNVEFTGGVSTDSKRTRNIYFYQPDLNLNNFTAKNVNIYGIKGSEVEKYTEKQTSCAFKDIISKITVKGTDKSAYDTTYILDNGPVHTITPENLGLKVYATYLGDNWEEIEVTQSAKSDSCVDGYQFSYDELEADSNNQFRIKFSGQEEKITILLKNRTLESITAKLLPSVTTVVEGENQLKKEHIEVIAHYNHGEDRIVTNDCIIEQHTIAKDKENEVEITFKNPYVDTNVQKTTLTVNGREKKIEGPLEVTYNYGEEVNGVPVGTKLDITKLAAELRYDNGTSDKVENVTAMDSVVRNVGENEIAVSDPKTGTKGTVTIVGISLERFEVSCSKTNYVSGDELKVSDFRLEAYVNNNIKVEKIDETDVEIEPKTVQTGKNTITVKYGNLSKNLEITATSQKVEKTEVVMTEEITNNGATVNSKIDKKNFIVLEYMNNGTVNRIEDADIEIKPYTIKEGKNVITVVYLGKEYEVTVFGVSGKKEVDYVDAVYKGTVTVNPGDSINLDDIEVKVYFTDGTNTTLPASEYYFVDEMKTTVCLREYDRTVNIKGIPTLQTLEPSVVPPTLLPTAEQPEQTEKPTEKTTEKPEEPVKVTPTVPVTAKPGTTTEPASIVPATTEPVPTVQTTAMPTPTQIVPTPDTEGVVFQMICNAEKIKLVNAGVKVTKTYTGRTVIFTFSLQNASGLKYQIVEKGKKVKNTAWKSVKNNTLAIKKETKLSCVYFTYKDKDGKEIVEKTTYFALDKSKPKTNVKGNGTYHKKVKITFKDGISGVKKATLNGKKIKSGTTVKKNGSYKLVITDNAGNKVTKKFKVTK